MSNRTAFVLITVTFCSSIGCDRFAQKPKTAAEEEQEQQLGTDDAAKEYAKTIVLQHLGVQEADFGWRIDAKKTTVEVKDVWWEVTGTVKVADEAGKSDSQDFLVSAVKPVDSNRWRWVTCAIGKESYTNPLAF
ncbi:MAG: hypothetical protein MI757_17495 [Pirellulales bacterium]|nr:hypothetical protein [Pirellulales bacterium]